MNADEGSLSEVIRPAAVVPPEATREILAALSSRDLRHGGVWTSTPTLWTRFDDPVLDDDGRLADPVVMGTIHVVYGAPSKFEVTIYRATITHSGTLDGWTVTRMCDEALAFGGLTLRTCPRADMVQPPRPFLFDSAR
jgi:hypothetical protein